MAVIHRGRERQGEGAEKWIEVEVMCNGRRSENVS